MSVLAFGNLIFVGNLRGTPINGFTAGFGISTETQDRAGGKPATLVKGPQLMTVGFSAKLNRFLGNATPEAMFAETKGCCESGIPHQLILDGRPFDTNSFILKSGTLSDTLFDGKLRIVKATLELEFEEFATGENAAAASAAPGVSSIEVNDAYKVNSASADEKAALKREPWPNE